MRDRKLGTTQRDYEDWWYSEAGQAYVRQFKQVQAVVAHRKQQRAELLKVWAIVLAVMAAVAAIVLVGFMVLTGGRPAPSQIPAPPNPGSQTSLADSLCNYYISTTAAATGDGSFENPWPWDSVIAGTKITIGSSDTTEVSDGAGGTLFAHVVCGRAGSYTTSDSITIIAIDATPTNPVVIRGYPGERMRIDEPIRMSDTWATTDNVWFWNVEIVQTDASVTSTVGLQSYELGTRIINSEIHDVSGAGVGWWVGSDGAIYGSIFYNNGIRFTVSPFAGNNIYTQNDTTVTKTIMDNFFGPTTGVAISLTSSVGDLSNYVIRGNVIDHCSESSTYEGIILRSQQEGLMAGNVVDSNMTHAGSARGFGQCLQFGPTAQNDSAAARSLTFRGNYMWDGGIWIDRHDSLTNIGNTYMNPGTADFWFMTDTAAAGGSYWDQPPYDWEGNNYLVPDTASSSMFRTYFWIPDGDGTATLTQQFQGTFGEWIAETNYDTTSTASSDSIPAANKVFVRPNLYEDSRGMIVVYNWEGLDSVNVDVTGVLNDGDAYEIVAAYDYWGTPLVSGTWSTPDSVKVPMSGQSVPTPLDGSWSPYTDLGPAAPAAAWRFEVFFIRRQGT